MKITRLWGEQPLGELEEEYRKHFLDSDIRLSSVAIIIWLIANTAFIYADYILSGTSLTFWVLLASRTAVNAWGICLVLILRKVEQASTYDWLLLSFLLSGAAIFLYSNFTRPIAFGGPGITNALGIMSVYLVFQTRMSFRILTNSILSFGIILIVFFRGGLEPAPWTSVMILSVLLSNALGIPVAALLSNLRRAEFMVGWRLRLSEQELRREIAKRKSGEEALRKAKEVAESATKAKGEFLANMSHEIRTPLNAVSGMIDLMLDSYLMPKHREQALVAKSAADSLLCLVNDILDFSKIEAGKLELEEKDFSLRSVLAGAQSLLAVRAQDKSLDLTYSADAEVPDRLRGDPNRLRQIVLNLGMNGIKFTEQGRIAIRVNLKEQQDSAVCLHFAVEDTGVGIPAEKLEAVFDRFTQLDASLTKKHGGTGLGLAISSQLAQAMGGEMWGESKVGKGSTFHFTARFKLSKSDDAVDPESTQQISARVDLTGLRVLLAEDDIFNQAVAVEVLRKRGCEVSVASNGREAVEAFGAQPFDVILMDLQMPEMDGFQATRIIRSRETTGRIPIIAQTAHAFAEYRERCLAAGMDEHVSKPIAVSELLRVLERFTACSEKGVRPTERPSEKTQAAGMGAHTPAFDFQCLLDQLGGDEEAAMEILGIFSSRNTELMKDIRSAVITEDWDRLAHYAHTMKGASATLGAYALAARAEEMEHAMGEPNPDMLQRIMAQMDLEVGAVEQSIREIKLRRAP